MRMPLACSKQMAAGKPAVATRVGRIPSLVLQNSDGLLVEPRDTLAFEMRFFGSSPNRDFRLQIGRAGQRFVGEQFRSGHGR